MDMDWLKDAKDEDPSTWPTKEALRKHLGLHNRTIERWAKTGKLRTQQRRAPGFKPAPVYHPEDARKLCSETMPVVPQSDTTATPVEVRQVVKKQATIATPQATLNDMLHALVPVSGKKQKSPLSDALLSLSRLSLSVKTFLNLAEAALLLGVSEDRVKRLAGQGLIPSLKGQGKSGRWTFCRADLLAVNLTTLTQLSRVTPTVSDTTQSDNVNGHVTH